MAVAAERLGYEMGDAGSEYHSLVLQLLMIALEPLRSDEPYDFARSDMARNMAQLAESVSSFREFWRTPPSDVVYFHRKVGGMFMLASRLKARVNVYQLTQRWLA
jgi:hypothetical protein